MEYRRAGQTTINGLEADTSWPNGHCRMPRIFYKRHRRRAEDDPVRAQALSNLASAQSARDRALYNLNYATGLPDQNEIDKPRRSCAWPQPSWPCGRTKWSAWRTDPIRSSWIWRSPRQECVFPAGCQPGRLAELELKAPFSATVGKVNLHSGEWAAPGRWSWCWPISTRCASRPPT
jgi:hypothetical protein